MTKLESAGPNAKQFEAHDRKALLELHEMVDHRIAAFGRRAMSGAALRSGHRVLDVGCRCDETTVELALRVGETGFVMGVAISRLLVDTARPATETSSLSNVHFEQADAQTHSFAAEGFDVVFYRFGIVFFDDPTAAFANLQRPTRSSEWASTLVRWSGYSARDR